MERDFDRDAPDPRQLFSSPASSGAVPCHVIRALMPAMSGGDLEPKTADILERHTGECLSCRRERMRFDSARSALASLAPDAPETSSQFDDNFFESLRSGIVGEIRRDTQRASDVAVLQKAGHVRKPSRVRELLPAGLALAATLVGGIWVGRSMQDPVTLPPPPAASVVNAQPGSLDPSDPVTRARLLQFLHSLQTGGVGESVQAEGLSEGLTEGIPSEVLPEGSPSDLHPVNVGASSGRQRDF